jgi:uncharacterized RDD family membrane protein YckC
MASQPEPNAVAGVGRRLVAGLIDTVLMVIGFVVILFLVAFFMGAAGASDQEIQGDGPFWLTFGL